MQVKYDEVISWSEMYDSASFEAKKMIVANLIKRVEVGTNYQIHIDLNIDLAHFNIQLNCCTYGQVRRLETSVSSRLLSGAFP